MERCGQPLDHTAGRVWKSRVEYVIADVCFICCSSEAPCPVGMNQLLALVLGGVPGEAWLLMLQGMRFPFWLATAYGIRKDASEGNRQSPGLDTNRNVAAAAVVVVYVCMCVCCGCVCAPWCTCGGHCGMSVLLSPFSGSQRANSGCRVWRHGKRLSIFTYLLTCLADQRMRRPCER